MPLTWITFARPLAALACAFVAIATTRADVAPPHGDHFKVAEDRMLEARMLQKFAMVDWGNVQSYTSALGSIDTALAELSLAAKANQGTEADRQVLKTDAETLKREITELRRSAHGIFFGRFPLVRGLGIDKPPGEMLSVSYDLDGSSRRKSLAAALGRMIATLSYDSLEGVVLIERGDLDDADYAKLKTLVDKQAALSFSTVPNVKLLPNALRDQLPPPPAWTEPDSAFAPLCRKLLELRAKKAEPTSLLIILARPMAGPQSDCQWFQVQSRQFDESALAELLAKPETRLEAYRVRMGEGLNHDRGPFFPDVLMLAGLLAVVSLLSYVVWFFGTHQLGSGWQNWLIPPVVGFVLGLLLPATLLPALRGFAPSPTTAAEVAAWWPAAFGALTFLLPAVVYRLAVPRLAGFTSGLYLDGRWAMSLVAVGLGAAAFWGRVAFIAVGSQAPALILPLVVGAALVMYLLGRVMDRSGVAAWEWAIVPALLTIPLGLGTLLAEPNILWATVGAALVMFAGLVIVERGAARKPAGSASNSSTLHNADAPRSLEQLRACAESPPYRPARAHAEADARLQQAGRDRTSWLSLCGASGAGKTAAAEKLIADIRAREPETYVLVGRCLQDTAPYHPFREALAEVWTAVVTATAQPHSDKLDSMLQELVGMVVPFWGMLSSIGQSEGATAASRSDLYAAVSGTLRRLAKEHRVVLFIEDVQWLDEGSADLLRHLHERFPENGAMPLVVLLTGRESADLARLGLEKSAVNVPLPAVDEQVAILSGSLRIAPESAEQIVAALGEFPQESGGLFWLGRTVAELVDAGALEETPRGFALKRDFLAAGKLPVPDDLRRLLAARLRETAEHGRILQCAAVLGSTFRATDVAEALGLDRLELLEILRQLDERHRIVSNLPESDELVAFSSAYMLEVVRQEFGIAGGAQLRSNKVVQELHARLAQALERRGERSSTATYELARHYFFAGSRHAGKSAHYCLAAAQTARREFAFDEARRYLAMATEASRTAGLNDSCAAEALLLECAEANVTGRERAQVARRGQEYLAAHPDAPHEVVLAVARSCYDAGRDTDTRTWYASAAELARKVIDVSDAPLEQAAAYHVLGMSLRFDDPAKRGAAIRRGLDVLNAHGGDRDAHLLKAWLLSSLAEQTMYGEQADLPAARAALEQALEIREKHALGDLPGQARLHGSLGRLALECSPKQYDVARHHFAEDLRIAQEIGDAIGISQCESSLGDCDYGEGNLAGALEHYRQAHATAPSPKDRLFALTGMFDALVSLGQTAEAEQVARKLLAEPRSQVIPRDCVDRLVRVLATHSGKLTGDWPQALHDRVAATSAAH